MCPCNKNIDVIIPLFNEQENIIPLIKHTSEILRPAFEKIFFIIVDDGSMDETEKQVEKLEIADSCIFVKYIKLVRNYGKDLALKCGVDNSNSELCVMMDGDFQHPPEAILEACEKINEGYNIVHILKEKYTAGSKTRKLGSHLFNKLINHLSEDRIHLTDYKLLDHKAVNVLKNFKEVTYSSSGIIDMIGLKFTSIKYKPQKRIHGETKFSFRKLVNLSVKSITNISVKPLRAAIYIGFLISSTSFLYGLWVVFEFLFLGQPIPGFPTLAAAIFFLGGAQFLFLGILGEYIGKIFIEAKKRPQYIIDYIKELEHF